MRVSKLRTKKSSVSEKDKSSTDDDKSPQKKKPLDGPRRVRKKSDSVSKDINDISPNRTIIVNASHTEPRTKISSEAKSAIKQTPVDEQEVIERTADIKSPLLGPDLPQIVNGTDFDIPSVFIKEEPMDTEEVKDIWIERERKISDAEFEENLSGIEMVVDEEREVETVNADILHMNDSELVDSDEDGAAFVPPAALGKRPIADKPPSDIFKQELEKFVRETLKGGCLSLAEFKKILQLRQQGKSPKLSS